MHMITPRSACRRRSALPAPAPGPHPSPPLLWLLFLGLPCVLLIFPTSGLPSPLTQPQGGRHSLCSDFLTL